jgi:hypothetical protein
VAPLAPKVKKAIVVSPAKMGGWEAKENAAQKGNGESVAQKVTRAIAVKKESVAQKENRGQKVIVGRKV